MTDLQPSIHFSTLLASSVHDMKNSITLLLLSVQELLEKSQFKTPEEQLHLSKLEYEARRINSDLIQLLTLYRLDEKTLGINQDETVVLDLLNDQFARNESLFTYRNLKLSIECDPGLIWYLDAELIGSVINNLLVNAARYARREVKISAYSNKGLIILIEDDGEGFPDFMLETNLEGHATTATSFSGTGLGLLFARQILALHQKAGASGSLTLGNRDIGHGGRIELQIP